MTLLLQDAGMGRERQGGEEGWSPITYKCFQWKVQTNVVEIPCSDLKMASHQRHQSHCPGELDCGHVTANGLVIVGWPVRGLVANVVGRDIPCGDGIGRWVPLEGHRRLIGILGDGQVADWAWDDGFERVAGWCVCVCACVCVCMCACTCACTCMHAHMCVRACVHAYMCACVHVCVHR